MVVEWTVKRREGDRKKMEKEGEEGVGKKGGIVAQRKIEKRGTG